MTDLSKLRAELRAGLEGVTPGRLYQAGNSVYSTDAGLLAIVVANIKDSGDGNLAHIVRCSPDNIRALLDALDAAEKVQESNAKWINHLNVRLGEEELRSNQMEHERDEALRQERDEARAKALEEAAEVAKSRHLYWRMPHKDDAAPGEVCDDISACEDIAAAIKALKDRAP